MTKKKYLRSGEDFASDLRCNDVGISGSVPVMTTWSKHDGAPPISASVTFNKRIRLDNLCSSDCFTDDTTASLLVPASPGWGSSRKKTLVIIDHGKAVFAERENRPLIYLTSAHTHASGESKEDMVRSIAGRHGMAEGSVSHFLGGRILFQPFGFQEPFS
uniref:Uncharacterized protein n=1 Tax=Candidatus Kentrum sp. TC TaxID=2126339 RepID=A0A450YIR7_9GAMM|nr:MAG: hypothetical protein BECKTC1821D_GA0114238_101026 [Candidatus Kentron sp. TC]